MTDTSNNNENYLSWFRHSSPYINRHRGKTFVIMLPGDCFEHENFSNIINDLVLLKSLGVRLIIVHGARPQIDTELSLVNEKSEFHKGARVTQRSQIKNVIKAVGAARFQLEASFSAGLPGSPLHESKIQVSSGNFVSAKPKGIIDGVDFQLTGKVRSIDDKAIRDSITNDKIVLVSPIGYSLTGELFNLSFADISIEIALALKADKLIAYNDDGPIMDGELVQFRELTLLQCEKFLLEQQNHNHSNTYFSLRACHKACEGGISRAHVISAQEDGALIKELFTRDGSGTMVYRDSYETVRRARIEDVVGLLNLMKPLEEKGVLVKRSRERLETEIDHFIVMEKDDLIIGCAALYPLQDNESGELACMAIDRNYQRGGRAAKLLNHVEKLAQKLKLTKLYALTTQTSHWFMEQGFTESHVDMLPVERKSLYNFQRQSKVFLKRLS